MEALQNFIKTCRPLWIADGKTRLVDRGMPAICGDEALLYLQKKIAAGHSYVVQLSHAAGNVALFEVEVGSNGMRATGIKLPPIQARIADAMEHSIALARRMETIGEYCSNLMLVTRFTDTYLEQEFLRELPVLMVTIEVSADNYQRTLLYWPPVDPHAICVAKITIVSISEMLVAALEAAWGMPIMTSDGRKPKIVILDQCREAADEDKKALWVRIAALSA